MINKPMLKVKAKIDNLLGQKLTDNHTITIYADRIRVSDTMIELSRDDQNRLNTYFTAKLAKK